MKKPNKFEVELNSINDHLHYINDYSHSLEALDDIDAIELKLLFKYADAYLERICVIVKDSFEI